MPTDAYMIFTPYTGAALASESSVDFGKSSDDKIGAPFISNAGKVFEVDTFSFGIEQTINMSSQGGGAGAGKVQFNEFSIERKIDKASPQFFQFTCQGKTYKQVSLGFRKAGGTEASGVFFLRFDFKFVAVKTMSWSHGDESPTESVTFEYGGLQMLYGGQAPDGKITPENLVGWNKIKNILDVGTDAIG